MTDSFRLDGQPSITAMGSEMRSYYGRPILKAPVWKRDIAWYLFSGGLAGASSTLAPRAS